MDGYGVVLCSIASYVYYEPFALIHRRLISPWHRDNKLRPSGTGGSEISFSLSMIIEIEVVTRLTKRKDQRKRRKKVLVFVLLFDLCEILLVKFLGICRNCFFLK